MVWVAPGAHGCSCGQRSSVTLYVQPRSAAVLMPQHHGGFIPWGYRPRSRISRIDKCTETDHQPHNVLIRAKPNRLALGRDLLEQANTEKSEVPKVELG
ncbi:hypothetical protein NDU88_004420 [Pleurodeles waltl]|uniref:Uncharacterized protein n=1 Tax=Pleurodeles waltl TaxID=8319 RepID=A0AAV7NJI1_PLEWA|nr:hypothetical protein NDU88_004420 [Pleurodeles waltl]